MKLIRTASAILLLLLCVPSQAQDANLRLDKVTVLSRHGVRAPLEKYFQDLEQMVPEDYHWSRWSVEGSHLTLKGAALETLFGEYFRLWLAQERFELSPADVYFGASSKQRTVATARSFAAGMLPLMDIKVDYKTPVGYLDPDYLPLLNCHSAAQFDTLAFKKEAYREIGSPQAPSYRLLEKVLRYEYSALAAQRRRPHLDNKVSVRLDFYGANGQMLEPSILGDLNKANRASDAFILQYYENPDLKAAAFGRQLEVQDWRELSSIKSAYDDILFTAPIVAVNISHCMMLRLQAEMSEGGHKFAFLCSHDSMIQAVLSALQAPHFRLPGTIEGQTPIGVKLVLEQWINVYGDRYVRPRLIYQSSEQIRNMEPLDLENPPFCIDLSFRGLTKSANGMYRYEDFMRHLQRTIDAYAATAKGQNPFVN